MTSPLSIGVTIGLRDASAASWSNSVVQCASYLARALRHCPNVATVTLANTTAASVADQPSWAASLCGAAAFDDVCPDLDVVIELGGQLDAARTARLHERGAKLVSCCCASEYVQAMQAVLFDRTLWGAGLFVNREYDDLWVMPNVARTSAGYFGTFRRKPAKVVPFLWDPAFLTSESGQMPGGGAYSPRESPRRVSVMEPNVDVERFCFYPALIADEAYRRRPDAISLLQVTHAGRIASDSQEFISLMGQLDLVRDGKAVFHGDESSARFLASSTDVVVSHQWGDPLALLYFEACWQGYPLVHNGDLCRGLGYYYVANDIGEGCAKLLEAIDGHDAQAKAYRERQRSVIESFLPSHPAVTHAYAQLLDSVVAP